MKDHSQNPHPSNGGDYDFTQPVQVKVAGNSPPMEGVDANNFNGTTHVPKRNEIIEGRAKPLERTQSKRKKPKKGASNKSLKRGRDAFLSQYKTRPSGQVKQDKNLVT